MTSESRVRAYTEWDRRDVYDFIDSEHVLTRADIRHILDLLEQNRAWIQEHYRQDHQL